MQARRTRHPRVTACEEKFTTRFLKLSTLSYEDKKGRPQFWDVAQRTTRAPW